MVSLATPANPAFWVLHDGKAGMASQALGLAEATGFPFIEKRLVIRFPWSALPPGFWFLPFHAAGDAGARLVPPWPDLIIACGRNSAMPALAIKRASGGRTVAAQIQNPSVGNTEFDLFVVPEHDRLRGPQVIVTRGAVHRVTPARLAAERRRFPALAAMPRPILSVLIGGTNKAYRLSLRRLGEIAEGLAEILRASGGSALVTPSRRTGEAGLALLRDRLEGLSLSIWDGSGENPYFAYLALADAFLVTADSVSMISEAAATGKPVHILGLDGGNAKFSRFHAAMQAAGVTRPFVGRIESWSYPVPDDTARAGAALRALFLSRIEHWVSV
jgi:mitochondrial fission protein ELM1